MIYHVVIYHVETVAVVAVPCMSDDGGSISHLLPIRMSEIAHIKATLAPFVEWCTRLSSPVPKYPRFSYNYTSHGPEDEPTFQMSLSARVVMEEISSRRCHLLGEYGIQLSQGSIGPTRITKLGPVPKAGSQGVVGEGGRTTNQSHVDLYLLSNACKFTQDGTTTCKYGGTGLGPSITQRFCHMMGCSVSVERARG